MFGAWWTTSGLKKEPLPAAEGQNLAYVLGRLLRMSELTATKKVPYNLEDKLSKNELENLTAVAALRALKHAVKHVLGQSYDTWEELLRRMGPKEWKEIAQKGLTATVDRLKSDGWTSARW